MTATLRDSYMKYRYENLLLRLFLGVSFVNVVLVGLVSRSFASLYLSTLIFPIFLAFAHLPPGKIQLLPFQRRRADVESMLCHSHSLISRVCPVNRL